MQKKKKKRKETRPPTYTIYRKLKMDKRLKFKSPDHKNPRWKVFTIAFKFAV